MRLQNIAPQQIAPEQAELFRAIRTSISKHLQGFVTERHDGALIGPFNILLHFPHLGTPLWALFDELADHSTLPVAVREIAILLTGAKFKAPYETYSHEATSMRAGLPLEMVASLAVGACPPNLTREQRVAFEIVTALLEGTQLPGTAYRVAQEAFGDLGIAEIACTIGCYTAIATLLNAFDLDVPAAEFGG